MLDPDNPYVLRPHLCAAAAELALTEQDLDIFGPAARTVVDDLTRGRAAARAGRPAGSACAGTRPRRSGLRGAGLAPVRVVEEATGRLVGTMDEPSAHLIVHDGAVYLHQGESYLVQTLDLATGWPWSSRASPATPPPPRPRPRSRSAASCAGGLGRAPTSGSATCR